MAALSISQLSALTGRDRRTVTARLVNLDFQEGPDNAHLYDSAEALAAIYNVAGKATSLEEEKANQCREAALLSRARREEIQKTRIPLAIPIAIWDAALQSFGAKLKAKRGRKLTTPTINDLLADLRDARLPLAW